MRLRRLRWGLVGALGCAVAVPAQGRVGSDEDRAREIEKQVTQALREGRKLDAAEGYREAWQIYKNPWYMCNIGGLETEMGRDREAAESLSACLRLLGPEDKKLIGPKVERMLNEARMDKAVGLTAIGVAGITVAALGGSLLVYEFVRSAPEGRTAGARVSVTAAPGGGSLQITGSF